MGASASVPWGDFTADPRVPAHASLRASDRDRDVVQGVLGEAFADGRLSREEFDERAAAASTAKTLGELPALVADLAPQTPIGAVDLRRSTPEELHTRAVRAYEASRQKAFTGLLVTGAMLTGIWWLLGHGGFYWPAFFLIAGCANLLRVLLNKRDMVEEEEKRLERRERRRLEPPPPGGSGPSLGS